MSNALGKLKLRIPRLRWALRKMIMRKPPKGDVYYGDMAALYDEERAQTARWHAEHAAVQAFLESLPRGLSVLDVPVGTGRFLELYKQQEHQVTGFDSSHEMLSEARKRAEGLDTAITLDQGDATQLPFDDAQFDLVVSTRFLRHVLPFELAKQSLAEMGRVTREHAIIEMGFSTSPTKLPRQGKPIRDGLNYDDLVALFAKSGFEVVDKSLTKQHRRNADLKNRHRAVFLLRKLARQADA